MGVVVTVTTARVPCRLGLVPDRVDALAAIWNQDQLLDFEVDASPGLPRS